ncbi:MAG: aminoacyl-tRNA hydrolase [Aerococcus sanguinicola]
MKLVAGLGNPGPKYERSRHNIGFITLDEWAYQHHLTFDQEKFKGKYVEYRIQGEKVFFVKPQTFMNLSGESLIGFVNYFDIELEDLLVVYDDMDMDVGRLRMRRKGSSGGHNGMKSIIQHLGTDQVQRLKLGVGRPQAGVSVVNHVLGSFPKEDHTAMLESTRQAVAAINYWLAGHSFEETMTKYNH